jgi:hypothetical protein
MAAPAFSMPASLSTISLFASSNIVVLVLESAETGLVCAEVDSLGLHYGGVLAKGCAQPLDLALELVAVPRRHVEVLLHLEPLLAQRFDVRT